MPKISFFMKYYRCNTGIRVLIDTDEKTQPSERYIMVHNQEKRPEDVEFEIGGTTSILLLQEKLRETFGKREGDKWTEGDEWFAIIVYDLFKIAQRAKGGRLASVA